MFRKVTEEEIKKNQIILSEKDKKEIFNSSDYKGEYLRFIHTQITRLDKIIEQLKEIELNISNNEIAVSNEQCFFVGNTIEKIAKEIRMLPSKFGDYKNLLDIKSEDSDYLKFEYDIHGDVTIIFPELLPKRLKAIYTNGVFKGLINAIDTDGFRAKCISSFQKEVETGNLPKYTGKVTLFITHYFQDKREVMDADNLDLDPKIIMDTICVYMLPDDSMIYTDLLISYKIGEYKHTEIKITPN